jgi:hypothetical protein
MAKVLLALLVGLLVGYFVGYRYAHLYIAAECKRLGGFFVDSTIFRCVEVDGKQADDHQHP